MNNRKPFNKRGKLTRTKYKQFIPEAQLITVDKEIVQNPKYPGLRCIIHNITPKSTIAPWGYTGQVL